MGISCVRVRVREGESERRRREKGGGRELYGCWLSLIVPRTLVATRTKKKLSSVSVVIPGEADSCSSLSFWFVSASPGATARVFKVRFLLQENICETFTMLQIRDFIFIIWGLLLAGCAGKKESYKKQKKQKKGNDGELFSVHVRVVCQIWGRSVGVNAGRAVGLNSEQHPPPGPTGGCILCATDSGLWRSPRM